MNENLDFKYLVALFEAIEAFSKEHDFRYRGSDLRYAVERELYFSYSQNKNLHALFASLGQKNISKLPDFQSEVECLLASYLLKKTRDLRDTATSHRKRGDGAGKWIARRIVAQWFSLVNWNIRLRRKAKPVILAHVVHQKFARFLEPVIDEIAKQENNLDFLLWDSKLFRLLPAGSPWRGAHSELSYLTAYYNGIYDYLAALRPKCVVLVEGNAPRDELVNQACRQLSIPTVCLQHGWSPVAHPGFKNMTYDKFLAWGRSFVDLLRPHNPQEKFIVCGSPHLPERTDEELREKIDRCVKKPGIGFFLQPISQLIHPWINAAFVEVIERVAKANPKAEVLVREHPNFQLSPEILRRFSTIENLRLVPPGQFTLASVLDRCLVASAINSSTLLESIGSGTIPVVFNATSLPRYLPDIEAMGLGFEAKDAEACFKIISNIVHEPLRYTEPFKETLLKTRRNLLEHGVPRSTQKIAAEILQFAQT